ncbi:MAG: hypothetical protein OEY61_09515 [Gammaproteobacteria bacterium]|nr:hypothetical protein [Gammaproteobacteria bacterium]
MNFFKLYCAVLLSAFLAACGSSSSSPVADTVLPPPPDPIVPTSITRTIALDTQLNGESIPLNSSVDYVFTANTTNSLYYIYVDGTLITFWGLTGTASCTHHHVINNTTVCVLENATASTDYQFNITNPNSADGTANIQLITDNSITRVADGTITNETISPHGTNHYHYTVPADGTYTLTVDGQGIPIIGYSNYFGNKCFTADDDCLFDTTRGITVTLDLLAGDTFHYILNGAPATAFTLSFGI